MKTRRRTRTNAVLKEIRAQYECLRSEVRRRWHRDLPFEELLFDRWERAKSLGFGRGSSIYHNSYVYGDVRVGRQTWIGPMTLLDGSGKLTIGSHCSISAGVQLYTHDTVAWALSEGKSRYRYAAVRIGNGCFIGPQSIVRAGASIGNHTVIGALSYVNRDIPPYSIAFGNPARIVGKVVMDRSGNVQLVYYR